MNIKVQRLIDRWVGASLCRVTSWWGGLFRLKNPIMPVQPTNILVILLSEMGSIVLAGPMFAELKRRYPSAKIHLLQLKKNQEVARMLTLVEASCMHAITDKGFFRLLFDSVRVIRRLRKIKPEVVIDCELFSRVSALFAFASGAPIISGFTPYTQEGLYRGSFITRPVAYNVYQHISKQFLTLVDVLKANNVSPRQKVSLVRTIPKSCLLSVEIDRNEIDGYWQAIKEKFPIVYGRRVVLFYVGGGLLPERAWPIDSYSQLASRLCAQGFVVMVVGLSEDKSLAIQLLKHCNSSLCLDLTGYTKSLRELLMVMHRAHLLVTNDGGPGHFATLTSIQSIVFFGPETGVLYAPLGDRTTVLESHLACSPCLSAYNHRQTYCDGDNVCLKVISVETVYELSLSILEQKTNNEEHE